MNPFGSIAANFTEFYGLKGSFKTPNSNIVVHHVQTIAKNYGGSGNEILLNHLKPLRDYVDIKNVRTLDDVLQRDLDDSRVSRGLVEYLLSCERELPVFLPSIVVILVPSRFFNGNEAVYPAPVEVNDNQVDYGSSWRFVRHLDQGVDTNIVTLGINFHNTIPLVIDGQHRTAGFRYVSGKMDFSGGNEVYHSFYRRHDSSVPEHFDGDLPTTILWFDNKGAEDVPIKDFSRKLFVDINQSSQNIAKSRKILLDDLLPSGFLTRIFYDILAEKGGFGKDILSLFHAGFDYPKTLGKSADWSPTSIFIPEIVDYAIRALLYGSRSVNSNPAALNGAKMVLPYTDSVSFDHHFGTGMHELFHVIETDIDDERWATVNLEEKGRFRARFVSILGQPLYKWLSFCGIYRNYFDTSAKIEKGCIASNSEPYSQPVFRSTWQRIFCSGEGLYYSITDSNGQNLQSVRNSVEYVKKHILDQMCSSSDLDLEHYSEALRSTRSVAFFVGFTTVPDLYGYLNNCSFQEAVDRLVGALEGFNWDNLLQLILAMKESTLFRNIDPKSWTIYRSLIFRLVPDSGKMLSPSERIEFLVFRKEVETAGKSYATNVGQNWSSIKSDWMNGEPNPEIDSIRYLEQIDSIRERVVDWFAQGGIVVSAKDLSLQ